MSSVTCLIRYICACAICNSHVALLVIVGRCTCCRCSRRTRCRIGYGIAIRGADIAVACCFVSLRNVIAIYFTAVACGWICCSQAVYVDVFRQVKGDLVVYACFHNNVSVCVRVVNGFTEFNFVCCSTLGTDVEASICQSLRRILKLTEVNCICRCCACGNIVDLLCACIDASSGEFRATCNRQACVIQRAVARF